jgi:hypothetical protein
LVAVTVVLHGFALGPLARLLGLVASDTPGVLLVGGSRFTVSLARALSTQKVPVLISDQNARRLRGARAESLPVFYGDILSEAAETSVELVGFGRLLAATGNDAYNTLVATDLAPEFGRDAVFQLAGDKIDSRRHTLPVSLGGQVFAEGLTYDELDQRMIDGERVRVTRLSGEYTLDDWRRDRPTALLLGWISPAGALTFAIAGRVPSKLAPGTRLIALGPDLGDEGTGESRRDD